MEDNDRSGADFIAVEIKAQDDIKELFLDVLYIPLFCFHILISFCKRT